MTSSTDAVSIKNYINTLIFCIVAKAVTIALLVALLFDIGWKLSYIILTIEIGLITVVAITLYKIYAFNKKIESLREQALKAPPSITMCPDYFIKSVDPDTQEVKCTSTYTLPNNRYTYTFLNNSNVAIGPINLSTTVLDVKTLNQVCQAHGQVSIDTGLCGSSGLGSTPQANVQEYAWTDFKSQCGMLDHI